MSEENDMTQAQLVKEIQIEMVLEKYNNTTVSKWEHGRIPPVYIVEALEKLLDIPDNILLTAAGYMEKTREQGEAQHQRQRLLQLVQLEHISSLQNLARSIINSVEDLPDISQFISIGELFFQIHQPLYDAYERLIGDALWASLSEHLGINAEEIEYFRGALEPSLAGPCLYGETFDSYKELLRDAWVKITGATMNLVANCADVDIWEECELNPRCRYCPLQTSGATETANNGS